MADINITDNLALNADVSVNDDSPLVKAGLSHIVCSAEGFFRQLDAPVDQALLSGVTLGLSPTSPNVLSSESVSLTIGGTANATLSLNAGHGKLLFDDDGASPTITIGDHEAWMDLKLAAGLNVDVNATVESVGLELKAQRELSFTTYSLLSGTPLPSLRQALVSTLQSFGVASSPAALLRMAPGTVYETEATGSVTTTLSVDQGFDISALASVNLPVAGTASVQPNVSLSLKGSLKLDGDFVVRAYRKTANELWFGVYVESGQELAVRFTAQAGIMGEIADTDILPALLAKAFSADVSGMNIPQKDAINQAIKDSLDQSLSVQLSALASTSRTHEAAVLFVVDLSSYALGTDAARQVTADTDAALKLALRGDWTGLDKLANATRKDDIVTRTRRQKLSLSLNLFGIYNAVSVETYMQSCSVKRDAETNRVSIVDAQQSTRIGATVLTPAADPDKLRKALMQDFLCTITYAAVNGKYAPDMEVVQTYLDYGVSMSQNDMYRNLQLGQALGVVPFGSFDAALGEQRDFSHACVTAEVKYNTAQALQFFFSDVDRRTARQEEEIERVGRTALAQMILPSNDEVTRKRIEFLTNKGWDALWDTAREEGSEYVRQRPSLQAMNENVRLALVGDYITVHWWAKSIAAVASALKAALEALEAVKGTDATADRNFMTKRQNLANQLAGVTSNLDRALEPTWGEAVMFALGGGIATAKMTVLLDGRQRQYPDLVG